MLLHQCAVFRQHHRAIPPAPAGRARVVAADAVYVVAVFVDAVAQQHGGKIYTLAVVVQDVVSGYAVTRNRRQVYGVYLHDAQILRAVAVFADCARSEFGFVAGNRKQQPSIHFVIDCRQIPAVVVHGGGRGRARQTLPVCKLSLRFFKRRAENVPRYRPPASGRQAR